MRASLIAVLLALVAVPALGQEVTTEEVDGVRNLRRIGTTIACAGAIEARAVPDIAAMGFVSIINLRMPDEPGNDVDGSRVAAQTAGIRYVHIPWNGQPNEEVAGQFLDAITTPDTEPAFVHCAGGGRAATMWMIKRIAVDGWDVERATEEAIALGAGNPESRRFAAEFARANRR